MVSVDQYQVMLNLYNIFKAVADIQLVRFWPDQLLRQDLIKWVWPRIVGVASHLYLADRMASNFRLETQHVVVAAGPDQPQLFNFPKRSFKSKKVVKRSFQPSWFTRWPFLHYNESFNRCCILSYLFDGI